MKHNFRGGERKLVNCPQKFLQGKIEKNRKDNLRCQGHTELWTKTVEQDENISGPTRP